ncbi:MAG: hypothetical protein FD135_462 [Comamonadaceae bacterium]|nr:MAG: hypothetical protein FD135_462 [Comamonadaceae bacterium]
MPQMKGLVQNAADADRVSSAQHMPVDRMAQLFHVLLKDERISSAFRVWLARLQWPVLRLATLDPMGFQQETHPAYQWLFKVSSCILQPGDHIRPCGVFEEEIKRLILVIESFPEADLQVFEWAYSEFNQFLKQIHGEHPHDAITGCVACQQVQQEALAGQYRIAILDKLNHEPVEVEIRTFLSEIWPNILAAQAVNKGLEHPETLKLKHTAIELIRLNTALLRVHERKHAMAKVPKMIDTLRHGMQLLGLPLLEQDAHIQKIGANLSDAYMKKHSPQTAGIFNTERRTIQRGKKGSSQPIPNGEDVDGLQVIDDNSDIAWRMWECALVEQQSKRNSAAE